MHAWPEGQSAFEVHLVDFPGVVPICPDFDTENCGACGRVCPDTVNGFTTCFDGKCGIICKPASLSGMNEASSTNMKDTLGSPRAVAAWCEGKASILTPFKLTTVSLSVNVIPNGLNKSLRR